MGSKWISEKHRLRQRGLKCKAKKSNDFRLMTWPLLQIDNSEARRHKVQSCDWAVNWCSLTDPMKPQLGSITIH